MTTENGAETGAPNPPPATPLGGAKASAFLAGFELGEASQTSPALATMDGVRDLAQWAAEHARPYQVISIADPDDRGDEDGNVREIPVLIAKDAKGVTEVHSLRDELNAWRRAPERKVGTSEHFTLESFIAHVLETRLESTRLFAVVGRGSDPSSLTAVYDYNEPTNPGADTHHPLPYHPIAATVFDGAAFMKHRALYRFPASPEWQAWIGKDDAWMTQVQFAEFLEDRILDIAPADDVQAGSQLAHLVHLLGGKIANPHQLMELGRGLKIHVNSKSSKFVNLSTGEISIQFEEKNVDENGVPITPPNIFLIVVPLFEAGTAVRLAVRLRFRQAPDGPGVQWKYEIYRAAETWREEVLAAAATVESRTLCRLFVGTPELGSR